MTDQAPFSLRLTGDTAEEHQFQGYDGYNSLAGFAWTLSLIANYVETGEIRQRGDFVGRHSVRGTAPEKGSILASFAVYLSSNPDVIFGAGGVGSASALMYALTKRVIRTNLGTEAKEVSDEIVSLGVRRQGDIEALIAIAESPIQRMHDVIGSGANKIEVIGGSSLITHLDHATEEYVKSEIIDDEIICKDVSVASYNGNTGHGGVFDFDQGRVIPFSLKKGQRSEFGRIFTWGLDQYVNKTGKGVHVCFRRVLRLDGRPKKYLVETASY